MASALGGSQDAVGWLLTSSGGGARKWVRRWATLRGAMLSLSDGPLNAHPRASLLLSGAIVGIDAADASIFLLRWPENEMLSETEFKASAVGEQAVWVAAIRRALRWDRFSTGSRPSLGAQLKSGDDGEERAEQDARRKADALDSLMPTKVAAVSPSFAPADSGLYFMPLSEGGSLPGGSSSGGGGSEGVGAGAALVTCSLVELERWYFGISAAISLRRKLSVADQASLHRRALSVGGVEGGRVARAADAVARVALAITLEKQGDDEEVMKLALAAASAMPDLPCARLLLGRLLLDESDDAAAALPHLSAAVSLYERKSSAAFLALARAHERLRALPAAIMAYEISTILDPARTQSVHAAVGALLIDVGKPADALSHLKAAVKALPTTPQVDALLVHSDLAYALEAVGNESEAITCLTGAVREAARSGDDDDAPLLAAAHYQLGTLHLKINQVREALGYLRAAHDAAPGDVDRAVSFIDALLADDALTTQARIVDGVADAADADDDSDEDGVGAGGGATKPVKIRIVHKSASLCKAESIAETLLENAPTDSRVLAAQGRLCVRFAESEEIVGNMAGAERDFSAAERNFRSALAFAPEGAEENCAPFALALGKIARNYGRLEEALGHGEAALEMDAKLSAAEDFVARVRRLLKGLPEEEEKVPTPPAPSAREKAKAEQVAFVETGFSNVRAAITAEMTPEERNKAFFEKMREDKAAKEEEERQALEAKVARMTPEERAEYEAKLSADEKYAATKDRVLNTQLSCVVALAPR